MSRRQQHTSGRLVYSRHMNDQAAGPAADRTPRSRAGTYVAVIVVEVLVIAGLYLVGRYFSS